MDTFEKNVANLEIVKMVLTFPFLRYSIVQLSKTGFGVFCFFGLLVFFFVVVDRN